MTDLSDDFEQASEQELLEEQERHANYLELFLDLVFVYALTNSASLLASDLTWAGFGRAVVVLWLVWWQWSQFTWAGSAIDLQAKVATRVLILGTIPAALVVAIAIPDVFGDTGMWFGSAYLLVQLLVLGMQGSTALRSPATREAFLLYATVAAISPVIVFVGGVVEGEARVAVWVLAMLTNVIGALRASGAGEWTINPVHFTERHSLFVIIALGEILVAIGASVTGAGLTRDTFVGMMAAGAGASVLWWLYFAYIPIVSERRLASATPNVRGQIARDLFTFGHFPLIVGLVCYAVVAKHTVVHPFDALALNDRLLLGAAGMLIVGGLMVFQYLAVKRISPERVTVFVLAGALPWVMHLVDSFVAIGVFVGLIAIMQAVTLTRLHKTGFLKSLTK